VSPASGTAGTAFSGGFCRDGRAVDAGIVLDLRPLPAGLSVPGATVSGADRIVNSRTASISGTPTEAGAFTIQVRAWAKVGATGDKSPIYNYTINVAGGANAPPSFSQHPASQTVTAGSAVSFTVAASGTPTPTLQWRKNSVALSGQTGATLSIASAAAGDAGSYDCVATSTAGTATSSAATLTVNPAPVAPSFTQHPASQTVTAGSAVSFTVAASGTPTPTLQWRKNSVALSGQTGATLSIASAAAGDAGSYDCVATSAAGTATSNAATLTVNPAPVAPTFTQHPVSQTVTAGSAVSFTVAASGTTNADFAVAEELGCAQRPDGRDVLDRVRRRR